MVIEGNLALCLYNNHFCLLWKSENVSFNQAITELKHKFKVVDNFIVEGNVISHFKCEFIPKKIVSHSTICIIYDLKTHISDRAIPYCISFYRLGKIAGRYNRNLSKYDSEKFKIKKKKFVFDGDDCVTKALGFLLKLKGDERKVEKQNCRK